MSKKVKKKITFKKIVKYTTNILAILNTILLGVIQIWNIPYGDKISATIIVILGALGTYLTGDKVVAVIKNKEN